MRRAPVDAVIFTATENEARAAREVQSELGVVPDLDAESATLGALGALRCVTVCSGLGRRRLDRAFHDLTRCYLTRLFINFGAAGATNSALPIGAVTVPKECLRFSLPKVKCVEGPVDIDVEALRGIDFAVHFTRAGSGVGEVSDSAVRDRLLETLGVDAIDCETYRLASFCRQRGVRFLAVRAITDHADADARSDYARNAGAVLERGARCLRPIAERMIGANENGWEQ